MPKGTRAKKNKESQGTINSLALDHQLLEPQQPKELPTPLVSLDEINDMAYAVAKKEADAIDEAVQSLMPPKLWEMLKDPRTRATAMDSLKTYQIQIVPYETRPNGLKRTEIWMQGKLRKIIESRYILNSDKSK